MNEAAVISNATENVLSPVLVWGIKVIKAIQNFLPEWMLKIIDLLTKFSGEILYILLVSFILWCINYKKGYKLLWTVTFSSALNGVLKFSFRKLRPFQIDSQVYRFYEKGFSTPSGHSQISAAVFPLLSNVCISKQNKVTRIFVAVFVPFLIGFFRICSGVHFPTDVLSGWGLGALTAAGIIFLWDKISAFVTKLPFSAKILLACILCVLINQYTLEDVSMSGLFFGVMTGGIFMDKDKNRYDASSGTWWKKTIRYFTGLIIIGLSFIVLKKIMPGEGSKYYLLSRFSRYVIMGLLEAFLIPKFFVLIKLASGIKAEDQNA
jgi:membrane-associated phospholipid phosphatase